MNPPSNPQTHNPNLIRLYQLEVLGTFRIAEDRIEEGRETSQSQTIKGRKRQALLACLLEARIAGREEVSKTELIDSLLNEVPETQGLNALRIEVHRLRLRLHPSVIETTINGYRLGQISSDAELFLEGKDTRLWRGAYLDGIHFNRQEQRGYQRLLETLHQCALQHLQHDPTEAVRVLRILIEMEPFDLEYLRSKLQALRLTRNHRALRLAYHKARVRWSEMGEHLPEAWDVFLDGP
jgi:hypothetical protein